MKDSTFNSIKENFEKKTSEELISIWEEQDKEQYSDTAFQVAKELLIDRGILLPKTNNQKEMQALPGETKDLPYMNDEKNSKDTTNRERISYIGIIAWILLCLHMLSILGTIMFKPNEEISQYNAVGYMCGRNILCLLAVLLGSIECFKSKHGKTIIITAIIFACITTFIV